MRTVSIGDMLKITQFADMVNEDDPLWAIVTEVTKPDVGGYAKAYITVLIPTAGFLVCAAGMSDPHTGWTIEADDAFTAVPSSRWPAYVHKAFMYTQLHGAPEWVTRLEGDQS